MFIRSANKFESSLLLSIFIDNSRYFYLSNLFPSVVCISKKKKKSIEFDLIRQICYGENHFTSIYRKAVAFSRGETTKRTSFYSRNPRSSNPFSGGKERGCPFPACSRKFSKERCVPPSYTWRTWRTCAWIKLADVQLEFFTTVI